MEHPWRDAELLRELYWDDGLSIKEISDQLDCGHNTVHRWMKRHDIPRRKSSHQKPVHFRTDDRGYERWRHDTAGTQHKVSIHRLASVAWFGLDEVFEKDHIHHVNRIPWDNREGNLEPLYAEEHHDVHS